jgi:hypothetical protein
MDVSLISVIVVRRIIICTDTFLQFVHVSIYIMVDYKFFHMVVLSASIGNESISFQRITATPAILIEVLTIE